MPARKIGKVWRVAQADLLAWADRARQSAAERRQDCRLDDEAFFLTMRDVVRDTVEAALPRALAGLRLTLQPLTATPTAPTSTT